MRLSQRDAFGEHLVLTIHEEAHNGLPTGTQSKSHIVVKISAIPKYRLLRLRLAMTMIIPSLRTRLKSDFVE